MKRPFVPVVLAYVAGLLLAQFIQVPLAAMFLVAFVFLIVALTVSKFRLWLLWPLLLLAGWTNFSLRTAVVSPDDLRTAAVDKTAIVTLRGQMADTPRIRITQLDEKQIQHSIVSVHVRELQHGETQIRASGDVMVNTPGLLGPEFFAGQPVEIYGVLAPPSPPVAEGLFDYQKFLANRGIFEEVKTKSPNDWKITGPPVTSPPLTDRFLNWASRTLALGLPAEDEPLHLLWAMPEVQ
jgi:hypothetical protein